MATREMTNEACCRHLARPPPGRVALTRHAQPLVISVNHVTDADTIVFRAGATSGGGRSNDSLVMRRPGLGGDGCSTAPASTDDDRPNTVIACADCGCIDEREVVVTPCDGHRSAPAPTFRRVPQVRGWVTESASNARSRLSRGDIHVGAHERQHPERTYSAYRVQLTPWPRAGAMRCRCTAGFGGSPVGNTERRSTIPRCCSRRRHHAIESVTQIWAVMLSTFGITRADFVGRWRSASSVSSAAPASG